MSSALKMTMYPKCRSSCIVCSLRLAIVFASVTIDATIIEVKLLFELVHKNYHVDWMKEKSNGEKERHRDRKKGGCMKYKVSFITSHRDTILNDAVGFINSNIDPSILRTIPIMNPINEMERIKLFSMQFHFISFNCFIAHWCKVCKREIDPSPSNKMSH